MKGKIKIIVLSLLFLFLVSTSSNLKAVNYKTELLPGASIRVATESTSQGLRFKAKLTGDLDVEHGFYLVYGRLLLVEELEDAIDSGNLEINGKEVFKVEIAGYDTNKEFSVVLVGIPEVGYLDYISVFAYAGDYISKPVIRSVGEVAINLVQQGEQNQAYEDILDITGPIIIFKHEELFLLEMENEVGFVLPELVKENFEFLGWSLTWDGPPVQELDPTKAYILYAIFIQQYEFLDKDDIVDFLETVVNDSNFSIIQEGTMKVSLFEDIGHYSLLSEYLLEIKDDFELASFLDKSTFDENSFYIYGDGNYLYAYDEEYEEGQAFPYSLNSQSLEMFMMKLLDGIDLFYFMPISPKTFAEFFNYYKDEMLDYITTNDLVKNLSVKQSENDTIIRFLVNDFYPVNDKLLNIFFDTSSDVKLDLTIKLSKNNEFESLNINASFLQETVNLELKYVDYDIGIPEFLNYFDYEELSQIPYNTYNLYMDGEVHEIFIAEELIESLITYASIPSPLPYKIGYEVEGLYLDDEYLIPLKPEDYLIDQLDIYVKLVPKIPLQDYLDEYLSGEFLVLKTRGSTTYYETDLYAALTSNWGSRYEWEVYDKINDDYYYVQYYMNYENEVVIEDAYKLIGTLDFAIIKELLNQDHESLPLKNGYLLLEPLFNINNQYLYDREENLLFENKTLDFENHGIKDASTINTMITSIISAADVPELEEIYLDLSDTHHYIDIDNIGNINVVYRYESDETQKFKLGYLVDEGIAAYDYTLEDENIIIEIIIGEKDLTYNQPYYESSKGLFLVTNEGGYYYNEIEELPTILKSFSKVTGYCFYDDKNQQVFVRNKQELQTYLHLEIIRLHNVFELYELNEFFSNLNEDYYYFICEYSWEECIYDIAGRKVYFIYRGNNLMLEITDEFLTMKDNNTSITFPYDEVDEFALQTLGNVFGIFYGTLINIIIADNLFNNKYSLNYIGDNYYYFDQELKLSVELERLYIDHYIYHSSGFMISFIDYEFDPYTSYNYEQQYNITISFGKEVTYLTNTYLNQFLPYNFNDSIFIGFYLYEDGVVNYEVEIDYNYQYLNPVDVYAKYLTKEDRYQVIEDLQTKTKYQLVGVDVVINVDSSAQIDIYYNNQIKYILDLTNNTHYAFNGEVMYQLADYNKLFNIDEFIQQLSINDFLLYGNTMEYIRNYNNDLIEFFIEEGYLYFKTYSYEGVVGTELLEIKDNEFNLYDYSNLNYEVETFENFKLINYNSYFLLNKITEALWEFEFNSDQKAIFSTQELVNLFDGDLEQEDDDYLMVITVDGITKNYNISANYKTFNRNDDYIVHFTVEDETYYLSEITDEMLMEGYFDLEYDHYIVSLSGLEHLFTLFEDDGYMVEVLFLMKL